MREFPQQSAEHGARERPLRGRRLAAAQGRHAVLGQRGDRRHPRRQWRADRLRQDHSRHDREARDPAAARGIARAIVPLAEDGGARAADRRPCARLQQSADRDPRRDRPRAAQPRRRGTAQADARRHPQFGAARRGHHQAAARLRARPAARDQDARPEGVPQRRDHADPPVGAQQHRPDHRNFRSPLERRRRRRRARARAPQSRLQCARCDEGRRNAEDQRLERAAEGQARGTSRANMSRLRVADTGEGMSRRDSWNACSSRSSRPRTSARALAWASARYSALPSRSAAR